MRVLPVPCLSDNYAYLLICDETKRAAIVDPSTLVDTEASIVALAEAGITLSEVWATHHHGDHVGGALDVCKRFDVPCVVGFEADRERLPGLTLGLADGDVRAFGSISVRVMHVPGHTSGALAYVCEAKGEAPCVFSGDTLFAAGCGRLFEGTPAEMHASLARFAALHPTTRVYPGHEYTIANLVFAMHLEPSNAAIAQGLVRARALRAEGKPTVPTTIADELAQNPFLRSHERSIRLAFSLPSKASDVETFAATRKAKDTFTAS